MRALLSLLSLWLVSAHAKASCAMTAADVVWTYPANGERDVPTNAVFWVLSSGGPAPTATLNDAPLTVGARGELRPGTLLPDHTYVLSLSYPSREEWLVQNPIEITFHTGKTMARAPAKLRTPQVERTKKLPDQLLPVLTAHDCYDTMQDTLITFRTRAPGVIAFLIGGRLWPAAYGAPSVFTHAQYAKRLCVELVPIGEGGLPGRATRACAAQREP